MKSKKSEKINELPNEEVLRKILVNYKTVRLRVDYMEERLKEIHELYNKASRLSQEETADQLHLLEAKYQLGLETSVYWIDLITKITDFLPFDCKEKTAIELLYIDLLTEDEIFSKMNVGRSTLYRYVNNGLTMLCNCTEILVIIDEYKSYYREVEGIK